MTSCGKAKCDPNCVARRVLDAAASTSYNVFIENRIELCEDLDATQADAVKAACEVLLLEPDMEKRVKALGGIIGFYTLCLEILQKIAEQHMAASETTKDCQIN